MNFVGKRSSCVLRRVSEHLKEVVDRNQRVWMRSVGEQGASWHCVLGEWRRVDVSNLQAVFGHKSCVSYLRQIIAKIRWIAAFYLVHRLFE